MKVAVVGTGYVGLVSAVCFAEIGHDVVCVDVDPRKIERINNGEVPILEEGLEPLLVRNVSARRLRGTTDLAEAMADAEVSMIAVGTPFNGHRIDLSFVQRAAQEIGACLRGSKTYHVVCVKSTVVPGTTERVVGPAVEAASGRTIGDTLGLSMNPEFLAEGTAVSDFMNPDRIVIGATDARACAVIRQLYAHFPASDVVETTPATAEMIKYTANAFLATVISFANEVGNLCTAVGNVDIIDVMRGVHLDRRLSPITPAGRIRPGLMSFLLPGTGFGGSCFPKDVKALIGHAADSQAATPLLQAVIDTNTRQPDITLALVRTALRGLNGRRIAVLGLAFKPGTDDVRESPAEPVIRGLVAGGARVTAHDPAAIESMRRVLADVPVDYCQTVPEAIADADAIVLITSWPEYAGLASLVGGRDVAVIDGRRFLKPTDFNRYSGIGWRP